MLNVKLNDTDKLIFDSIKSDKVKLLRSFFGKCYFYISKNSINREIYGDHIFDFYEAFGIYSEYYSTAELDFILCEPDTIIQFWNYYLIKIKDDPDDEWCRAQMYNNNLLIDCAFDSLDDAVRSL